jgi:hypothetical protein
MDFLQRPFKLIEDRKESWWGEPMQPNDLRGMVRTLLARLGTLFRAPRVVCPAMRGIGECLRLAELAILPRCFTPLGIARHH